MRGCSSRGWGQVGRVVVLMGLLVGGWLIPSRVDAQTAGEYFASTGHYLDDEQGFLSYWREQGGEQRFGAPVTAVVTEQGLTVQYFERGRLEAHPERDGSPILPGRIGADYAAALWKSFRPAPAQHIAANAYLFEETGYTVREPFLGFWRTQDGIASFGYPISELLWEYVGGQMVQVQYFERGRLEQHRVGSGTLDSVRVSALGRDLALLRGHDTTPQAAPQEPVAPAAEVTQANEVASVTELPAEQGESAFSEPELPAPALAETLTEAAVVQEEAGAAVEETYAAREPVVEAVAPSAPRWGGRHVVVSLSQQWLYAYEGDVLVFDAPVSTGKNGFNTPVGNFAIYAKNPLQTMSGTIGGERYSVPNVPHAMYIYGDVALHGTYWHNMFGTGVRVSHGCINLPVYSAAWLYSWAPVGTPVQVSY